MGPPNGVAAAGIAGAAIRDRPLRAELEETEDERHGGCRGRAAIGRRARRAVRRRCDRELGTRPRGSAAAGTRVRAARAAETDQLGNRAALHGADVEFAGDAAALDQHNAACDIEHELEILLDDQHREAMFLAQACQ